MTKRRKLCASLVMLVVFAATVFSTAFISPRASASPSASAANGSFTEVTEQYGSLALETEQFAKSVKRLSDVANNEKYITLIASLDAPTVLDVADGEKVADIIGTAKYNDAVKNIKAERKSLLRALKKAKIKYTLESEYDTVLAGVAVRIETEDFERAEEIVNGIGGKAIVSETYYAPQAIESAMPNAVSSSGVTENKVKVYETGIFDSSDVEYKGDGVVVAVLDSGFDYTHPVFTESVPPKASISMDYTAVSDSLGSTVASKLSSGLTASDVYVSDKIPFAYDYADKDSDVYPLESSHGTHVASIIAGKSTTPSADGITITGVAPNAQLVLMKVFSDTDSGAKSSWLLNAIDDCVKLGVDVINMSLGSSAGFANEDDDKGTDELYDKVREAGISLIVAASNSYNATYGSEANGNLPLTSNPDSGTVGSPSTYASALSVASISGVKTPYLTFGGEPIYYYEANNTAGEAYNFMDMMLKGSQSGTFEYVVVPGIGDTPSYIGMDVKGKIALVRRGKNTFEEKVQAAYNAGASGVIIYNNVSGDIRMSVGNYLYDWGIGCISMSQDDGEKLASTPTGKITLSKENLAGPFMSDFSSWGPTASLGIKPEITAHGGDILAAIPGGYYDRLSGTSMASPNQAGVHALVRQYAKQKLGIEGKPNNAQKKEIAKLSNQLLMSTTDIAYNEFGNPYSVRKQGAGLANLYNAVTTGSYLVVKDGAEELDRTKLELGDDPEKSGVYTLNFTVKNVSNSAASFDVETLVYTESVSKTLTDKDETVSSERAYMLSDTSVSVSGNGVSGKRVSVSAGGEVDLTVVLTLSKAAKDYLDASFENGMYVEGFVRLIAADEGGVNLSAPFLAFYGDWTKAPIFDLTYFETNPDEINDAIDNEDKIKPDAWATRPIAGLSKDYIGYMGGYYWVQNPEDVQIPAQEEHIALTNHDNGLNSIYAVWAGLLRNAKEMDVTITDTVTGRQIYKKTEKNQRKSYNYGSMIGYSTVDVKFNVADYNLKNNTQYTVRLDARLDYERDGSDTNLKNSYEFTFTTDFEAPKITDVRYYSEYDENTRETTYYADIDVYDNHYAQALRPILFNGVTGLMQKEYFEPVYGSRNSTSTVTLELNDYIANIRKGDREFILFVYDYAMNSTAYKLALPQNIEAIAVSEENITLSENETKPLQPLLYPEDSFDTLLNYKSSNENVARVVNGTVLGVSRGTATITISSKAYADVKKTVNVTVLGEGDDGYRWFDRPSVNTFDLLGFNIDFAYYTRFSDEISVGKSGSTTLFDTRSRKLELFPGEIVSLFYDLQAYYPNVTDVVFTSGNPSVASVDQNGKIRALRKGRASITASVWVNGEDTRSVSASVDIEVQDPYVTSGAYLTAYKGIGENLDGRVEIPTKLNLTTISQFAFSLSKSVDKAPEDITEEDPYYTTSGPVGEERIENQIKEVIIPEGVELIDQYAFANMTALKKVYLPKSLRQINAYAFQGCKNLTHVVGLENVKIISHNAFNGCANLTSTSAFDTSTSISEFKLTDAIAIGAGAFKGTAIREAAILKVESAGAGAFENCKNLTKVTFGSKIKIDASIFAGCNRLTAIEINSPVISEGAFDGCSNLKNITLGKDVAEIGAYAFAGTKISSFKVADGNTVFETANGGRELLRKSDKTLIAVAPIGENGKEITSYDVISANANIEKIGLGAFSSAQNLESVTLPANIEIDGYAFYGCEKLKTVTVADSGSLGNIGAYAFYGTALTAMPKFGGNEIGAYAFAELNITEIAIPASTKIGEGAFFNSPRLAKAEFGQGVTIGASAFRDCSALTNIKFEGSEGGDKTTVGNRAFFGCGVTRRNNDLVYSPVTVEGTQYLSVIDDFAFTFVKITTQDKTLDLSSATSIGYMAFASNGYVTPDITSVSLSSSLKSLGDEAFYGAEKLTGVTVSDGADLGKVTLGSGAFYGSGVTDFSPFVKAEKVGAYAFALSALSGNVNLFEVGNLDAGAFAGTAITSATLKEGKVAEQLFLGAKNLTTVSGLETVTEVGAQAFAGTSISQANLKSAEYIGRLAFANNEKLTSVELGENIKDLGDNPFAFTNIKPFSRDAVTEDEFARPYKSYNFDYSNTVKVIDGALYAAVPNGGLELITYSLLGGENSLTVAEGTVRVSDYAAAGNSALVQVSLPYSLKSVGHAAFAACDNLSVVKFGSITAPSLEAEYNEDYAKKIDADHVENSAHSLGLTGSKYAEEYFSAAENVLFNNNFKTYIGQSEAKNLTMIYPKNGVGYDAYVIDNYFDFKIIGAVVADDVTRNVVALIDALPRNITLAHEEQVVAARRAYSQISDAEQSALVTNIETLVNAEKRIQSLKDSMGGDNKPEPPSPEENESGLSGGIIALVVVVIILGAALIATVTLLLLPVIKKRVLSRGSKETENNEKAESEIKTAESEHQEKTDTNAETSVEENGNEAAATANADEPVPSTEEEYAKKAEEGFAEEPENSEKKSVPAKKSAAKKSGAKKSGTAKK